MQIKRYSISDRKCYTILAVAIAIFILSLFSLKAQTSANINMGDDVTLIWSEKITNCDGCPKLPRPEQDRFRIVAFDASGDTYYNTGRDTTCKVYNIQVNTGFYALAYYTLPDSTKIFSHPSDTVYAWITAPVEGEPAIFAHDYIKIRDRWTFTPNELWTHKDKGVLHCITANPGPVSMTLDIGVDQAGEYLFRFEGWRYDSGTLILSVNGQNLNGIFNNGVILFPAVLEVGTHQIEVIAQGTSACFSLIRSDYLTQNIPPADVEGMGIVK